MFSRDRGERVLPPLLAQSTVSERTQAEEENGSHGGLLQMVWVFHDRYCAQTRPTMGRRVMGLTEHGLIRCCWLSKEVRVYSRLEKTRTNLNNTHLRFQAIFIHRYQRLSHDPLLDCVCDVRDNWKREKKYIPYPFLSALLGADTLTMTIKSLPGVVMGHKYIVEITLFFRFINLFERGREKEQEREREHVGT